MKQKLWTTVRQQTPQPKIAEKRRVRQLTEFQKKEMMKSHVRNYMMTNYVKCLNTKKWKNYHETRHSRHITVGNDSR